MHPLYVAFVWHMHQPYYRDLRTGRIPMPWVRMHAAKDYLHMGEALARHPAVHVTINMVPSLTEQVLAWAKGREADDLARVAENQEWSAADRRLILDLCYSISWDKVIRRYPRYSELLDRRPAALADPDAFTEQDYRDLLAWFNLAWIDPGYRDRDSELKRLAEKGRDFTYADLLTIHASQRKIGRAFLPEYRRLAADGQLEICTSPYYHPILPLLYDSDLARRASSGLPLPVPAFSAPEDAAAQLKMAVEAHTAHFGQPPRGLWPSEGAVAPEILPLVRAAGFTWLASGEGVLSRSIGRPLYRDGGSLLTEPRLLYQPYRVLAGNELGPHIVFRDQELADRIGFLYQHLPGRQAAEDMIYRLLEIRRRIDDPETPYLVTIILDGENCWEFYERNGDEFLDALYGGLSDRPELRTVTVNEFLAGPGANRGPAATLARLATGSWIGGDLTTWIGDPEHNRAWSVMGRARRYLADASRADPKRPGLADAWRALYAAEGSDWFWWYSHRNTSQQDALYDGLFRHDLAAVYEALGDEVPAWLAEPIFRAAAASDFRPASAYVIPRLSGAPYPGEAWAAAAAFRPASASTGAMQRAEGVIEQLFVGYDTRNLYLRLDLREPLDSGEVSLYLSAGPDAPKNQRVRSNYADPDAAPAGFAAAWEIRREPGHAAPFLYAADGHEGWAAVGPVVAGLAEKALEVSVPLANLGLKLGDELAVLAVVAREGNVVAHLPERAMGQVKLSTF